MWTKVKYSITLCLLLSMNWDILIGLMSIAFIGDTIGAKQKSWSVLEKSINGLQCITFWQEFLIIAVLTRILLKRHLLKDLGNHLFAILTRL